MTVTILLFVAAGELDTSIKLLSGLNTIIACKIRKDCNKHLIETSFIAKHLSVYKLFHP